MLVASQALAVGPAEVRPGMLTVVVDDNYPPYIFRNEAGAIQGILKDQWDLWSRQTGIPVQLNASDWARAQQIMRAGGADVIDTIFDTEERRKTLSFSRPYARLDVLAFFHKSISGLTDAASLKGFSVGVKDGDACIDHLAAHGIANMLKYPSYQSLVEAAGRSEVRVFCMDRPPAVYLLHKHGLENEFRHSLPLTVGAFHRAVKKGNEGLLRQIEDGFAAIAPAQYREIDKKWLGASPASDERKAALRIVAYFLAGAVFLALLLLLWNISLRRRVAGKTSDLIAALQDLRQAKLASEMARDQMAAMLEAIPDLLFELDLNGRYYECRASRLDLLVAPPEQLLGHTVGEVMNEDSARTVLDALREANERGSAHGAVLRLDLPIGTRWFELSVARKRTQRGDLPHFIVLSRDISDRRQAEAEVERLAFFDTLTQLPNRRLLVDRLRRALSASLRRRNHGALLIIDLDDFKTLNDTRGHNVGDLLLREVALRLQHCIRQEDTVARLGGDEFVVMLEDLSQESKDAAAQTEAVCEKILSAISVPYILDGQEQHTTASIGISLFSGYEETEEELLKRADAAMYRAKTSGRNTVRFFDPAMQAALEGRAQLEKSLRRALPEQQLLLHFQPQIDSDRRIVGAEALLRWQHPERGLVPPGQFIPLAEDTGLIVPIGQWVLECASEQLKQWERKEATRNLVLAVNVSARQFRQPDFVASVRQIIQGSGIDAARLKIELTESLVLHDVADSIEKMHALRAIGVRFSMDDFGTGYSSLSYLKRLPLDQLKIDQSFVRDIVSDPGDAVIVQTIIGMAANLGLAVIAEGVETEAQREFLLKHGCRQFQGYLFGRPMPLADFEAQLEITP